MFFRKLIFKKMQSTSGLAGIYGTKDLFFADSD